jgi:type IV pilus assembly protein PilW
MNTKRMSTQRENHLQHRPAGRRLGFSLVEVMIGLTLGLILSVAIIGVYLAQVSTYKTSNTQALIQSAENAITELITPILRSAGNCGCTSTNRAMSNLNAGGPPPLGTFGTTAAMITGYNAAAGTSINITQDNTPNAATGASWSPALHASLLGNIEAISDVVIVLGPTPGTQPTSVTAAVQSTNTMNVQSASGIASGQFGAISDCAKATLLLVTGVGGNTITFASGAGALTNATNALAVNYPAGSQFIPMTQSAFFVAIDASGQSGLIQATMNSSGTWTLQSLVPGIETMQVLYGIGTGGMVSQYVSANAVTNWSQVYAVRLGFLIEGKPGSGIKAPTQYNMLGTTINVPADNRLRHVFEMTIALRNASS